MQFFYHKEAGAATLCIKDEFYAYLFKARRHRVGELIDARNLADSLRYTYAIESIGKKEGLLSLREQTMLPVIPPRESVLGWSLIEARQIEKMLPMLNEIGITTLALVMSDYSQHSIRIDKERMERILIHSCEQSGRSKLPEIVLFSKGIQEYFECYPSSAVMDFGGKPIDTINKETTRALLIGPEGGFSQEERKRFGHREIFSPQHNLILRSETAAIIAALALI